MFLQSMLFKRLKSFGKVIPVLLLAKVLLIRALDNKGLKQLRQFFRQFV